MLAGRDAAAQAVEAICTVAPYKSIVTYIDKLHLARTLLARRLVARINWKWCLKTNIWVATSPLRGDQR